MIKRRLLRFCGLAAKSAKLLSIVALLGTSACYARASPGYYRPGYYYTAPPPRHYHYTPDRRERRWHERARRDHERHERREHRWHERHDRGHHHHRH